MKRVCVFCSSSFGDRPQYAATARELAELLVQHGLGLVYGGSHVGLMGVIADRVLELGGEVVGVIPATLVEREIAHTGLTQLHVVQTMHERKALMARHADAFLALPGGFGTLEELMEVATWRQLGLHKKPIALLNTLGYYDRFIEFIAHTIDQRMVAPLTAAALQVATTPAAALELLHLAERALES